MRARAPSVPFASRFFNDSFFSRCSRAGGTFRFLAVAKSGLSGEDTAGACCSSSRPWGLFIGMVVGVEPRGVGDVLVILPVDSRSLLLRILEFTSTNAVGKKARRRPLKSKEMLIYSSSSSFKLHNHIN